MSFSYSYPQGIDLLVEGRITPDDAGRQTATVHEILRRLKDQPGLILADEVGMGKTFVALAVAISVYLKDKRPTVVMIPPNLIDKWPNDFRLFRDACVKDFKIREQLRCGVARKPEEFMKLLDDSESKRAAVIFLTHGALTRNMGDGWFKLAIIQRALYHRYDTKEMYESLRKYAGILTELKYVQAANKEVEIWEELLNKPPEKWKKILVKHGFFTEEDDDPVPNSFVKELYKVSTKEMTEIFDSLRDKLPRRTSDSIDKRLKELRQILSAESRKVWKNCLTKVKLDLPLLIFDEAHHLKNSKTDLVTKLFSEKEEEGETSSGILTGQFDRILFLTATPFQLGHHELMSVLDRFSAINWKNEYAPPFTCQEYKNELDGLLKKLDNSQIAAKKLDNSWGKLTCDHLVLDNIKYENVYEWWQAVNCTESEKPALVQNLISDFALAKQKLQQVEPILRKYIIRHLKPRAMTGSFAGVPRRHNLPGDGIVTDIAMEGINVGGLQVTPESILPFLLAARLTSVQRNQRPVFAEGLASSFQAFRNTRQQRLNAQLAVTANGVSKSGADATDTDDDQVAQVSEGDKVSGWYLDQLDEALALTVKMESDHPKLKPTVDKAMDLWSKGEKVLIFCHYIATGKSLRQYISNAMRSHIKREGARKFEIGEDEVFDHLEKIGHRITSLESELHSVCVGIISGFIDKFPDLKDLRLRIIEAMLRYMKTPSFLVRFASSGSEINDQWLQDSFDSRDHSGVALKDILCDFLGFLNNRKENREQYIDALRSIQPGGIRAVDVTEAFANDEPHGENETTVMANVRLCYGQTKPETRLKLMKTFNTPFFPDILITSSVMAEGVDLHLNCRHIIHHDLSWNPSTLEQRTGRVDRIGAKVERCGQSIKVYLPYLSETQDEKMYRVVTERERWFNIIMGEKYKVDALSVDKYAERIPLPEELAMELAFRLEVELISVS
jgi:superfamily II DNA or RNA helicase